MLELLLFLNMKSRNAVKLAMKLAKCCFIMLHSSVFGKVRELVGEIKYAFVVDNCAQLRVSLVFRQLTSLPIDIQYLQLLDCI